MKHKQIMQLYPWFISDYQKLTSAFQQNRAHHALLFKAEQGLGIEQFIWTIANFLICQHPQKERNCGKCHSCQLFQANNHPDFHLLTPIQDKDIGIDQVRNINEKINQHAQQNGNKIIYIQGIERLTENAANGILKTLEEPRPNTYFLLQADLSSSLMPTIYSRCQVWLSTPPQSEIALNWLIQQTSYKKDDIQTALRINYGRPLSALNMLQDNLLANRHQFLRQFWLFYSKRSPLELLPYFEDKLILQQLDWLSAFLCDALKAKLGIQENWICQDLKQGITQFNEKQDAIGLLKANQIIQKIRSDLNSITAINQELILLDGLTRLVTEVFEPNTVL